MLSVEEALARVLARVPAMPAERVSLDRALGRVLAHELVATFDIPPWDNSAMDGFAVIAADCPGELRVVETVGAGKMPTRRVERGTATRIMTGAPMPEGADAVVMVEDTEGSDPVRVQVAALSGQNVRRRGGDVSSGATVLSSGRELGPAELGLAASLGLPSLEVTRRPRVAVLSTGDEVVEPGLPRSAGQIYSSNTTALMAQVRDAGGEPIHCGIAPDDPAGLRAALDRVARTDLVLTTGGVSVGDFDFVKDAFSGMDFWRVAMQPGKPLAFGEIGGVPAFGLPGNPVSCMVGFEVFVRPYLRRMLSDVRPDPPEIDAKLGGPLPHRPGRVLFARVALGPGPVATPTASQSSGVLTTMVLADGLAVIPADVGDIAAGETVRVRVLRWTWV